MSLLINLEPLSSVFFDRPKDEDQGHHCHDDIGADEHPKGPVVDLLVTVIWTFGVFKLGLVISAKKRNQQRHSRVKKRVQH